MLGHLKRCRHLVHVDRMPKRSRLLATFCESIIVYSRDDIQFVRNDFAYRRANDAIHNAIKQGSKLNGTIDSDRCLIITNQRPDYTMLHDSWHLLLVIKSLFSYRAIEREILTVRTYVIHTFGQGEEMCDRWMTIKNLLIYEVVEAH